MPSTTANAVKPGTMVRKILLRLLSLLLIASLIGFCITRSTRAANGEFVKAGFGLGVLHGALMPCTMPELLVGYDLPIYARNNTGRTYKLGYTVGVNGCGLIFFSILFWRVGRWRKRFNARS